MKKTKSLVGRKYGKLLVLAETNKLEVGRIMAISPTEKRTQKLVKLG